MNLERPWQDFAFVAFDTETSGKFPLGAEICEIAGVKWRGGEIVDTFEALIKPKKPMGAEVIAIHGITNEMVANAPSIESKIGEFHRFIQGAIGVAHHAPFDLGFLAHEFERAGLTLPPEPAICTSLLSRRVFPESSNHQLQTLIRFFGLNQGQAHRALDDTKACLEVGFRCMQKLGDVSLSRVIQAQGADLRWDRFSMQALEESKVWAPLVAGVAREEWIEIEYGGGTNPGQSRLIRPEGVVRSLDGDYVVAFCDRDQKSKRFQLEKIKSSRRVG